MGEDNRRKHTRIEVSFQVELYTDKGNHLVAKVRDLSFGGLAECETANSTGPEYMIRKKLLDESEFPVM